jgi:hypothetical protein
MGNGPASGPGSRLDISNKVEKETREVKVCTIWGDMSNEIEKETRGMKFG